MKCLVPSWTRMHCRPTRKSPLPASSGPGSLIRGRADSGAVEDSNQLSRISVESVLCYCPTVEHACLLLHRHPISYFIFVLKVRTLINQTQENVFQGLTQKSQNSPIALPGVAYSLRLHQHISGTKTGFPLAYINNSL